MASTVESTKFARVLRRHPFGGGDRIAGRVAEGLALALALGVPREDDVAVGRQELGRPPVAALRTLDGPAGDRDHRVGPVATVPEHPTVQLGPGASQEVDLDRLELVELGRVADRATGQQLPEAPVETSAGHVGELRPEVGQLGLGAGRRQLLQVRRVGDLVALPSRGALDVVDVVLPVGLVLVRVRLRSPDRERRQGEQEGEQQARAAQHAPMVRHGGCRNLPTAVRGGLSPAPRLLWLRR